MSTPLRLFLRGCVFLGLRVDNSQFLTAVLDVIRLNYPVGSADGLSAARIGLLVRHAFPKLDWVSFGYPKLKDVLAELVAQGLIRTGSNRNGAFSVWLASESPPPFLSLKPRVSETHSSMLRRDIWYAFVSSLPLGPRFLDRNSGAVRMAVELSPSDMENWVEIQPVSQEVQKGWASEFLSSHNLLEAEGVQKSLSGTEWFRSLADFLSQKNPELLSHWNRLRTQNTISQVRRWCEEHSVPFDLVTELPRYRQKSLRIGDGGNCSCNDLRQELLNAIQRLPTSDLLELPIKAKYLVQALRPDLASGGARDGA